MDKPERLGEQTARSPQNGLFRTCMNAFVPARTNGVVTCASQRSGTVDTVKQVYSDKPTMEQARCHTDRQIPACMPHLTRITASPVVHCLLPRPVATPPAAPPANPPAALPVAPTAASCLPYQSISGRIRPRARPDSALTRRPVQARLVAPASRTAPSVPHARPVINQLIKKTTMSR